MSLVTLPTPLQWPWQSGGTSNFYTFSVYTIDAAGEKAAGVFSIPKAGSITKIWFRTATVTTGDTVDCRLETVSTTDGTPTGTLFGTNTNVSVVIDAADDNKVFKATLTAAATVAVNDQVAVVIANGAGGGAMTITLAPPVHPMKSGNEYGVLYTSSWAKAASTAGTIAVAFEYSDGSIVVPWISAMVGDGSGAMGTNRAVSSGTQAGAVLTTQLGGRITAVRAVVAASASRGDIQYKIYRSSDLSTPVASSSVLDDDIVNVTTDFNYIFQYLTTPIEVLAGESLYVVLEASAATVNLRYLTSNSGDEEVLPAHETFYTAYRAGTTGAFTTAANEYPLIQLVMDQLDTGTGMGNASMNIGI